MAPGPEAVPEEARVAARDASTACAWGRQVTPDRARARPFPLRVAVRTVRPPAQGCQVFGLVRCRVGGPAVGLGWQVKSRAIDSKTIKNASRRIRPAGVL
jgi:hypothetical protein